MNKVFDLKPAAIEQRLKLRNPIYKETAAYGHMGRTPKIITKHFKSLYNAMNDQIMAELNKSEAVKNYLLNQKVGSANMLFLQNVNAGEVSWTYKNGLHFKVSFSKEKFPSIGIWWNKSAYPDEEGCRRNECAFEPIPGMNSVLIDNYKNGTCLSVMPGGIFTWQIRWDIFEQ